jgi:hypothetical protein
VNLVSAFLILIAGHRNARGTRPAVIHNPCRCQARMTVLSGKWSGFIVAR